MKQVIFENKANPFSVPDGYFDALNERIMNRIQESASQMPVNKIKTGRIINMPLYLKLVAAAACILFIFAGGIMYLTNTSKQPIVATSVIDEDFYQWMYASDLSSQMAESLNIQFPEYFFTDETDFSEEDEAIIQFLERDNIQLAAILYSFDEETFLFH